MKELSIEEKARAYDNAVKKATDIIEGKYGTPPVFNQSLFDYLFIESEDERIRKSIIAILNNYVDNSNTFKPKMIAWLEKQGEQKPANKIEPKFKVGDYVVGKYISGYISEVRDDCYLLDYQGFSIDKQDNYHLWTIADAKPGDILACSAGRPFIFKGLLDKSHPKAPVAYCGIDVGNEFIISSRINWWTDNEVFPATKEQRSLLLTKMREAGYKWDTENKKLKKINNEEIDDEDYGIDGLWHAQRILEETLGSVDGYQTDDGILEHKAAITAVKKLYGQKPSWSEEDEETFGWLCTFLKEYGHEFYGGNEENVIDFLKSLKERYIWKPSEQQIRSLEYIINNTNNKSYSYNMAKDLLADLKKLKG